MNQEKPIITISKSKQGIIYNVHKKTDITWLVGVLEYIKVKIIADNE